MSDASLLDTPAPSETRWWVGRWIWLPERRRLLALHGDALQEMPVSGRAAEVLGVLLNHAGQPVSKNTLLDTIWPDQDVEEGNLAVHISALRKALGPEAIVTIPGLGYRFCLPVSTANGEGTSTPGKAAASAEMWSAQTALSQAGRLEDAASKPEQPRGTSNLPARLAPLLGRDTELADLVTQLKTCHLLTLVGPAGTGKTALARHVAAHVQAQGCHPDGVWWVEAAELRPGGDLAQRTGQILGLPLHASGDAQDAVCRGLASLDLLLVLDNCEHLVAEAAALVQAISDRCPRVSCLLTSQEPLKLPGERLWRLGPLAMPEPGTPPARAWAVGALALLKARAQACDRKFRVPAEQTDRAIELCQQLDGNPLAIEMAAARLPLLGLEGVIQRLDERLRMLVTDHRLGTPRHRSLQAALDWSHGLLSPSEQAVMRRLAVFRGGFSLDLAQEVVADGHTVNHWDALDGLGGLVDKSLVQLDLCEPLPPRYHLLESTRLYAMAQLQTAGELESCQERLSQAMTEWARLAMQRLWLDTDRNWLLGRGEERANLQIALDRALTVGDPARVAPLFEATVWLSNLLGGGSDNRPFVDPIAALAEATEQSGLAQAAEWAGRLWQHLGSALRHHQSGRAVELFEKAAQQYRRAGDSAGLFRALAGSTISCARHNRMSLAQASLNEMRSLANPAWPPRLTMFLAEAEGFVAAKEGRLTEARQHYERYITCAKAGGVEGALSVALVNLADIALALGDVPEAARLGRDLVARLRQGHNRHDLGWALGNLTGALVAAGELDEAERVGKEALTLMRMENYAAWLFDPLALLAALRGRWWEAAWLLGHGEAAREAGRIPREPTEAMAYERAMALLRAELGDESLARAINHGSHLTPAEADALVMAW